MKSIKFLSIISIAMLFWSSCSDFLDKTPHSLTPETYFNTEPELQLFLTGVYSPLMQDQFYANHYPMTNAGGDDLSFYQRKDPPKDGAIMCNNANSTNPQITMFWRILYDGVNRANMLIENADRNPAIPKATRDRVKAEALFLRSFYYFNLVQGWGDVPMILKATNSVEGLNTPKTSKQVIYDQIIKDIVSTIPNLKPSTAYPHTGAVTQSAAQGILARIYLFRAGENKRDADVGLATTNSEDSIKAYFTHARDWAMKVKASAIHGLVKPYSQVFVDMCTDRYNSTGVRESIWEVELAGNRAGTEQSTGRIGNVIGFGGPDFTSTPAYQNLRGMANPGYSYKFVYASLKLYEMYDLEGDTARGNWNITPYEYTQASTGDKGVTGRNYYFGKRPAGLTEVDGYKYTEGTEAASLGNKTRCAAKYRRELEIPVPKNKNHTPNNFPILRYSDILLMIAEADNEINTSPTKLAYESLDAVRKRADIASYAEGSLTKDQLRNVIKKERAMEFCFEATRRWDLIRWGDFYQNMNGMEAYVNQEGWGNNYKYALSYYKVSKFYNYYPIPDMEMGVNKAITQNNPGW